MKEWFVFVWLPTVLMAGVRTKDEYHALTYGADACEVLKVVDDKGTVVANATVMGNFHMYDEKGNPFAVYTDSRGIYVASGKCVGDWHYVVKKGGYYETSVDVRYYSSTNTSVRNGRWQPYGMTNTVVLKRKVKPVAMCVKSSRDGIVPPVKNEYLGFDFEKGDWVKPHGKGEVADLSMKYEYETGKVPVLHYRGSVFLSFTNKYDGAYVMKKEASSSFRSVYQAGTRAVYRQDFAFIYDRLSGAIKENSKFPDSDYLILRTRSITDESGNLISAHYSKIYGPIAAGGGGIYMGFYFNPNENDPNLEADTTRNLLNPSDLGFAP